MKRLTLILTALILFTISSCEDPNKSRQYMDEGAKLMLRYSKYEEAEEAFTKAIKYDKSNYEAFYYRGCAKVNATKYKDAIVDFEKS